jgi:hypothetical protein
VTAAGTGPNGHVRDLAPDMAFMDGRPVTDLLHLARRGRSTIASTVRFGHVRDLARGMAGTDTSERAEA